MKRLSKQLAVLFGVALLTACGGGTLSVPADGTTSPEVVGDAGGDVAGEPDEDTSAQPVDLVVDDSGNPVAPGAPCDDGDPCTPDDRVQEDGSCSGGEPVVCDDGRGCTDDLCDGLGDCVYQVKVGFCIVNGICYAEDEGLEGSCGACRPELDVFGFSPVADGSACEDGDACTGPDECLGGFCSGEPVECDDDNECTVDSCDPLSGCINQSQDGLACGDEGPCVTTGICVEGACEGLVEKDCDDGNPCTADECGEDGECEHAALDGLPCDDGDVCTTDSVCVADSCEQGQQFDCNDGNECTADFCHPVSGCYHELNDNPCCDEQGVNACDDGNWCTTDSCDPETGECFYDFNDFACNDSNPCTGPDACDAGICGGPQADCDDGNDCTVDSCLPESGCAHEPLDGTGCDDGLDCSTGDACIAGECVADLSQCGCQPEFHPEVNKINALLIGKDGKTGSGLDVDGNPQTCTPAGCEAGIDNSLSPLASFANEALVGALADGSVVLLLEHRNFVTDGTPYELAIYIGEAMAEDCDIQSDHCDYLVKDDSFGEDCAPIVSMDNAQVTGNAFTAGGPGYNFSFPLPLAEGVTLTLNLYYAQLAAEVTYVAGKPSALDGVLAGAVDKAELLAAIDKVPGDSLPMDKSLIIQMVDMLVVADIDTNSNGTPNAASIGLPFAAISGTIAGTTP